MMERLKVAPLFIIIIMTKVWVMADTSNTFHWATEIMIMQFDEDPHQRNYKILTHFVTLLPLIIVINTQLFLHLKTGFSFKQSCLGSMANVVSLGRSTLNQSHNKLVSTLYCRETIVTSIYYLLFPILCLFLKNRIPSENYRTWTSYTGLALSVLYLVVTQVYTNCFSKTLSLEELTTIEDSPVISKDVETCEEETGRINGSSIESDQNKIDSTTTSVEADGPQLNRSDQSIESYPNSEDLGKEMVTLDREEGDLKKINKVPQHKLKKQIKRKISDRVIKKDRWVRIFAAISAITFMVTMVAFALVEHSKGKHCTIAIVFLFINISLKYVKSKSKHNLTSKIFFF